MVYLNQTWPFSCCTRILIVMGLLTNVDIFLLCIWEDYGMDDVFMQWICLSDQLRD